MGESREVVDVTDRVVCFEKGKTFECDCGQGFGLFFEERAVVCPSCGKLCVDEDWMSREPIEPEGQTNLSDW